MGSCAAPSAKGDDKFITTDYLQQCRLECYQRFQARAKTGSETDADPNACDSSLSD
ncbi:MULTISPECIES: DUF3330 domain-containing protein [Enterobacteriaceae]|uniref:DUF3330 domain-containing protein n=1 Tax=Enterobacteriaceae TaxID=543 RepID=UPI00092EA57F|nr:MULTISPECIES: DUF3330 domain-containing protein [Enterobacteriaceae]